jgi:hypothetical protein
MNENDADPKPNNPACPEGSEHRFAERGQHVMEASETLVKTLESILEEREASQAKEKNAIESLNGVLQRMGYQIVPLHQDSRRRRGRGGTADPAHVAPGPETHGDSGPRRRGRPSKVKTPEEGVTS